LARLMNGDASSTHKAIKIIFLAPAM